MQIKWIENWWPLQFNASIRQWNFHVFYIFLDGRCQIVMPTHWMRLSWIHFDMAFFDDVSFLNRIWQKWNVTRKNDTGCLSWPGIWPVATAGILLGPLEGNLSRGQSFFLLGHHLQLILQGCESFRRNMKGLKIKLNYRPCVVEKCNWNRKTGIRENFLQRSENI